MTVLAKQEGDTQRYIAHLLKLVFLAPDIIEAIIKGIQRRHFGFA